MYVYSSYKEQERQLKKIFNREFDTKAFIDIKEWDGEGLPEDPDDTLNISARNHGKIIGVICIYHGTPLMNYRYFIFEDGFGDGKVPIAYINPIHSWLSKVYRSKTD